MTQDDSRGEVTYAARRPVTSLYFHVPFCHGTCGYCDFFSVPCPDVELVSAWHEGVLSELGRIEGEASSHHVPLGPLETIYWGGGTPSYLDPDIISSILGRARSLFGFAPACDITLEANPESIVPASPAGSGNASGEAVLRWREAGVNRVSFGVQSATDALLRIAGRRHSAAQAVQAVCLAHEGGIRDISVDLMTGLPTQTMEDIEKALELVKQLPINHVSTYALSIAKGTPFYTRWRANPEQFPGDEAERQMNSRLTDGLRDLSFDHYEISNFARGGAVSEHNLVYWHADPYIAAGPAAASYTAGVRRCNPASIGSWLANVRDPAQGPFGEAIIEETVDEPSARVETMILGLRLMEGVSRERFCRRHGVDYDAIFGGELARLEGAGLIERHPDRVRLSGKGLDFADVAAREFL